MTENIVHVGIDVSKAMLDIDPFDNKSPAVKNTAADIRKLIERIKAHPHQIVVCCEASGGYEKLLCAMLPVAGIQIACVNAKRVRDYANSRGILAKTDEIDARVLSEFSTTMRPRLIEAVPSWLHELKALLIRREELQEIRKAENSRLDPLPHPISAKLIRKHIRQLTAFIKEVEGAIKQLVKNHDDLSQKVKRLTEVKSFGVIAAASLLAFIPELGHVTDNQAVALAGLAPYNRDSGTKQGKRMIRGGRSRVRRTLYMPAVGATTSNPIFSEFYLRLKSNGKSGKVALTAVMRKMVILANRIIGDPDFQIS